VALPFAKAQFIQEFWIWFSNIYLG